ncbi:MAG: type II secretion system protein [Planctomycetota bacterium]|nr:type II secretion system protein [Planctomycetota bacterium]
MNQTKTQNLHRGGPRRRGGFSLIELVVVVGVIITLISLVLAVSTLLIQANEARQLEAAFANLNTAVQEYEQVIGRPLTYQDRSEQGVRGAYDIPYNVDFDINGLEGYYSVSGAGEACNCGSNSDTHGWEKSIVRLFQLLSRTESAEEVIAKLDPSLFIPVRLANGLPLPNNQDLTTLVDPWGAAIGVVMPGRNWRDSDLGSLEIDSDGTIRTSMETKLGVCRNGQPLFVSSGPDGDIGCLDCSGGSSVRFEATIDNIYSYSPENQ